MQILTYAAHIKLQVTGKRDALKILKEITSSPMRARKYKRVYSSSVQNKKQLLSLRALARFVKTDFSRKQYEIIRCTNKKFFPCYSLIQKEKRNCYPAKESYQVTANCAEIKLQN